MGLCEPRSSSTRVAGPPMPRQFVGLPAHYVTAVLRGLENAARQGTDLDWPAIVPLLVWADEQAVSELAEPTAGPRQWKEARKSLMRLVRFAMAVPANRLRDAQDTVWTLIENAVADPDPTSADEEQQIAGGTHPEIVSMNTVRPDAINTAIDWGIWMRREDSDTDLARLFTLVDERLEVWAEPSRSARWVLGTRFATLIWFDREWAATRAARLFPLDARSQDSWTAAWNGYLGHTTLHPDVWTTLDEQYDVAVERLDPDATDHESLYLAAHLGWHLVHRYCVGDIDLTSPDSLLHQYYDRAPASVRADLLERIGHGLVDTPADAAARLAELLDHRLTAVQHGGEATELRGFGWWFSSGAFDDDWAVRRLRDVLTHTELRGTRPHTPRIDRSRPCRRQPGRPRSVGAHRPVVLGCHPQRRQHPVCTARQQAPQQRRPSLRADPDDRQPATPPGVGPARPPQSR